MRLKNLSCRCQAAHPGQRAVHHHHGGLELLGEPDGLGPITSLSHHRDVRFVFQNSAEAAPHQSVVVDQQN